MRLAIRQMTTEGQGGDTAPDLQRRALIARWLDLTRKVLPSMAAAARWPIRADHCFMRVCLDAAVGTPWTAVVARPAIHHLDEAQLREAIRIAESIVADPATLRGLNDDSLRGRKASRARP